MSKSYVTMEQHICQVCGNDFDTGALLLDKRMRDKFEMHTTTGYGLCPECQQKKDDGYIALVGVDESKSRRLTNGNLKNEDAHRTGDLVHLRASGWDNIFPGMETPENMVCFCEVGVIDHLKKISAEASDE